MTTHYAAQIVPLNADKIGTAAYGEATFAIADDELTIKITMHNTPANMQHWEHFHGFPDGKQALIATAAQDANADGFVDLMETEAVSGRRWYLLTMPQNIWIFPMTAIQLRMSTVILLMRRKSH
ncbi:hypothetical protein A4W81_09720 (plasmid) [Latilactobacillus sakei]|nr:hypothetical protein A4W81_09720 [Latilactobacillus sakei]